MTNHFSLTTFDQISDKDDKVWAALPEQCPSCKDDKHLGCIPAPLGFDDHLFYCHSCNWQERRTVEI